jgi:hypothetical protein
VSVPGLAPEEEERRLADQPWLPHDGRGIPALNVTTYIRVHTHGDDWLSDVGLMSEFMVSGGVVFDWSQHGSTSYHIDRYQIIAGPDYDRLYGPQTDRIMIESSAPGPFDYTKPIEWSDGTPAYVDPNHAIPVGEPEYAYVGVKSPVAPRWLPLNFSQILTGPSSLVVHPTTGKYPSWEPGHPFIRNVGAVRKITAKRTGGRKIDITDDVSAAVKRRTMISHVLRDYLAPGLANQALADIIKIIGDKE